MSHDPSICDCSKCNKVKYIFTDGIEIGRRCKIDKLSIEFWGEDKCPKINLLKFRLCLMIDDGKKVWIDNVKIIEARDLEKATCKYAEIMGIKYPWDKDLLYDGVFLNGLFTTIIQIPLNPNK